jgi:general secretion pathway protein K
MYSKQHQRSREAGIALLAVLWALLLLSALATAAAFVARSGAMIVHRGAQDARAEEIADAAILDTIVSLSDGKVSRRPAIDGMPKQLELLGANVTLTISNEAGRIDLNAASDELLLAFFQSQGLDAAHAAALVLDLRTLQSERSLTGDRSILSTTEVERIPIWHL